MNTVLSLFFYTTPLCFETSASSCKRASRLSLGFGFGSRFARLRLRVRARVRGRFVPMFLFFRARRSEKKNLGCIKKGKKYTRRERNKKKSNEVFGLHLIKNTRRVLSLCAHAPHETTPRCRHAQQQKHEEETR